MVTDDQRRRARERALAWQGFHRSSGHPDNQIANDASGYALNYIGALGEIVFADEFGKTLDDRLIAGGDGGVDCHLTANGIDYPVDVKTISFWGPNPRMMVTCKSIRPLTIYVAALYLTRDDDVRLLGWHWGAHLIRLNDQRAFSRRGTMNYTVLISECRPIDELKAKCYA